MTEQPQEAWLPVVGFEGHYEISDIGNLRRIATGPGTRPGRLNKAFDNRGYTRFYLSVDSKTYYRSAHRLVYEAFAGPIPDGMHINHKNGVKNDNRLSNLELATPSENTSHGFRVLGRQAVKNPSHGSANGRAKINESHVCEIKDLRSLGWSQQRIADLYGISQTTVSRIILGRIWKPST